MALPKRQPNPDPTQRALGGEPLPARLPTGPVAPYDGLCRMLFALLAGAVAVGCLLPTAELPVFEASDKIQHFAAFMALGAIGAIAFPGRRAMIWLAFALFAFGCLLEGLQLFVPPRQAALGDVIANSLGIAAGLVSGALALTLIVAKVSSAIGGGGRRAND